MRNEGTKRYTESRPEEQSMKVHMEPWRNMAFAVTARMRPAQERIGQGQREQNIKYPHNMTAFFVECRYIRHRFGR
jgi:hypothetical protein